MAAPRILIRTDAGGSHGWGHFVRCLSLASALGEEGAVVEFLMAPPPEAVAGQIREAGLGLIELSAPAGSQEDLAETLGRAQGAGLVLDGYHFDQPYVDGLRGRVFCLAIDDLMDRRYPVDLVLNHNLYAQAGDYDAGPNTRLLLGPEYLLLRGEFAHLRTRERPPASRVLITFGAVDPNGLNPMVLEALAGLEQSLEIKLMLGSASSHLERLESLAKKSPHQVELLPDHTAPWEVMAWAGLSISGSGITGYELACLGAAMLIITPVDNQLRISQALAQRGMAQHLGWWQDVKAGDITAAVARMLGDEAEQKRLSQAARAAIDGQGARRTAGALLETMGGS